MKKRTEENEYALVGGAVFDARAGRRLENQAVWIDGSRIASVCAPAELPEGTPRIDIEGTTVLPGMIDVHVHTEDWQAPLYLAKGITTVRDVGCELESILNRRARWNAPGSCAPRLLCTGPVLDCPGSAWPALTQLVHNEAESREQVNRLVDSGVDQIKSYAYLDWNCFSAILDQAHKRGKRVVAHLGKHADARRAIEAGVDEIEHLSGIGEALWPEKNQAGADWQFFKLWAEIDLGRVRPLIDLILEKRTWMAITRLVWLRLAGSWDTRNLANPQMAYVPGPLREFWDTFSPERQAARIHKGMTSPSRMDRSQQLAGMSIFTTELFRRNAGILIGTDAPFPYLMPGFSYHDEIHALLNCGLSETAALQAATLAAAQALEIDDRVGTIEPGKSADLIIVNGDPTKDIQSLERIAVVMRDGRWLEPDELLARAADYAAHADPPPVPRFDSHY